MDKHGVHVNEVSQCFFNKNGPYLEDTREKHKTNPPTKWFIAKTNAGRLLKVVFVYYPIEQELVIKSAFEPNQTEIDIYI